MALIPSKYPVRVVKSILWTLMLFFIVFGGVYLLSHEPGLAFSDLIMVNRVGYMIAFILLFGFVYPMITFDRKEVLLVVDFEGEKLNIVSIFNNLGYEQKADTGSILNFRLKNKFLRITRLFGEDAIELDYGTDNMIVLYGMKKEIYRIARHIEYLNQKYEQNNPD